MIPPADQSESCATGTQCGDTGRCVVPGAGPPSKSAVLSANPSSAALIPGGSARTVQVRLAVFVLADVAGAQTTKVRVVGKSGVDVACDATTFGHECLLDSWTFAFNGASYNAARPISIRSAAGTALGQGEVQLLIDSSTTSFVIPAPAAPPVANTDGAYAGTATPYGISDGFPITAIARGQLLLIRDPTRTIAPDGALVVDLAVPGTARHTAWLRPLGAADSAGAVDATYSSSQTGGTFTPQPDTLALLVGFHISTGASMLSPLWDVQLFRGATAALECSSDAECGTGNVCPSGLHACVPSVVWTPPSSLDGYQFEDSRSAQWWNAVSPAFGEGATASNAAFATTGADMIESLMCSTTAGPAHLGLLQIKDLAGTSRSGDLACAANGTGNQNDNGSLNGSPTAIGLSSYLDRRGSAVSSDVLATCLADLARAVTTDFNTNFNANTGHCVNLARALPGLRLLATGEHTKATTTERDPRLRALLGRLIQQWSELHSFLASTGLASRDFDDAIALNPGDARQKLAELLDVLDAGWAALLDKRIARTVYATAFRTSGSDDASFRPADMDYRVAKRPIVYWPFNAGPDANKDLIRNVRLDVPAGGSASCGVKTTTNSFRQVWSCDPIVGTLPAGEESLVSQTGDMTAMFNIDPADILSFHAGGAVVATQTMAVSSTDADQLQVAHPYYNDDTDEISFEVVAFDGFGGLGHWTTEKFDDSGPPAGTSVAIVRDATARTYTLYLWKTCINGPNEGLCSPQNAQPPDLRVFVKPYVHSVYGTLDGIAPGQIVVGARPTALFCCGYLAGTDFFGAYAAHLDDIALFDAALSLREFLRFAQGRDYAETRRDAWPIDMVLTGFGTQNLTQPIGAAILEAQLTHLDVIDRYLDRLSSQARAACESADPTTRAEVAAGLARVGRTLRQASLLGELTTFDGSDTTRKDRARLATRRNQISRSVDKLLSCQNVYGLGEREVPLYFGNIAPSTDERDAYFAASDYLQNAADAHVQEAQTALDAVRNAWTNARSSQLQQLATSDSRNIRVGELRVKYGEQLIRLCGMADRTSESVLAEIDNNTFSVDTCFLTPTTSCVARNVTDPVIDADTACYRGVIGGALLDLRAAMAASQTAYQSWQVAIGNATAAKRLCVLKEMDAFGCSAVDRHALSGVSCPQGHQGTLELIAQFNGALTDDEHTRKQFNTLINYLSSFGNASSIGSFISTFMSNWSISLVKTVAPQLDDLDLTMEEHKRDFQLLLQKRAAEAAIVDCWNQAEQYERAITAAQAASDEAVARMNVASQSFTDAIAQARAIVVEAPVVIGREATRPSIPIAFHYWLPQFLEAYEAKMERAQRYTYLALRATEYDMLETYKVPQLGRPSRGAVLGATRPDVLTEQLSRMGDQTATRQTHNGPPGLSHMAFDVGAKFFGLAEGASSFGATLVTFVKPVYSLKGEYLGKGLRFSLVPKTGDEAPIWRCAERIWRVNVGATGLPTTGDGVTVKLLKRNVFASRLCGDDATGFQTATLRPGVNLLVATGESPSAASEATNSPADVTMANFSLPDVFSAFKTQDSFLNGSSAELTLQGLYGDYVLLFPDAELTAGLALASLTDFWLRFDFLSIDNTPPTVSRPSPQLSVEVDRDPTPIIIR